MRQPFQSYAQNGEDVVLMRGLADVRKGVYIDVGAADPEVDNVTYAFYLRGWTGINIEPDAAAYRKLVEKRPRDRSLLAGVGASRATLTYHHFPGTGYSTFDTQRAQTLVDEGFAHEARQVPVYTLNTVIARAGLTQIHFLKIDCEGFERQVLEGIDLQRIRPWIIVVEATVPDTNTLVEQAWSGLLTSRGYRRCLFDGLNVFYCAEEHPEIAERIAFPANCVDHYVRADVARLREDSLLFRHWKKAFAFNDALRDVDLTRPEPTLRAGTGPIASANAVPGGALFVDITALTEARFITGIQRVSLNLAACLARMQGTMDRGPFFVRRHGETLRQVRPRLIPGDGPEGLVFEDIDTPVRIRRGDQLLFTCLDYRIADSAAGLRQLRAAGVRLTFWVYDLFPLARPDWSVPAEVLVHARWWDVVSQLADQILCDSWKVLVEVRTWLAMFPPERQGEDDAPDLRWLHLGADGLENVQLMRRVPAAGDIPDAEGLPRPGARCTFLAVASLHPRKAFDEVLDAFDEVWAEGTEVDLLISGFSWNGVSPDALMERIRTHPLAGTRLHYRGYLSDAEIRRLYGLCDALVYPSHDEGFGLPVVEAANYGMPAVLRDIPVLREVAGEHGFWFSKDGGPSLADAIREVHALRLEQRRARALPRSRILTWEQVTGQMLDAMGIARPQAR